ncbi:MAG: tRNA (adenosine(37)-N6)-dimethylallyltransferase MiaA [Nitrosomonadales bacterium]
MKQIFLIGPTASGKTSLAQNLYDKFQQLRLVNVDATQIYRGLNIGSGKLSKDELDQYPHDLINILNPDENYSVTKFLNDIKHIESEAHRDFRIPFLVGGTMMYFNSLLNPLDDIPKTTPEVRKRVELDLEQNGLEWLYEFNLKIDPDLKIQKNDKQRLQRALEVFYLSGKPISSFYSKKKSIENKDILIIGLLPMQRSFLHEAIEKRIHNMFAQGFIEEVADLYKNNANLNIKSNSMRSVGYKQVSMYLNNQISKDRLFEKVLFATRQLAKRQITWIKSIPNVIYLDPFHPKVFNDAALLVANFMRS